MKFIRKSNSARLMVGAAVGALTLGASAAWAQEKPINIPAQTLASALHDFGSQTGRPIMFSPSATASKVSQAVNGVSDEGAALAQLLQGTGLTFRSEGDAFVIVQAGEGGSSPQAAGAEASAVEALIVTAQKKEEQIQDVPIAISAFTQRSLDEQKLEGGFDLLKAIPNVTFSKSNFSGYNFSIRGVGTKAVSATTDPGVAVAFNSSTLIVNRLFEQEYFDVERVEVLRGPQGTLYGRNATGGVINVISAKPRLMDFEADMKLEAGNYNARRARGMVNIPIGDTVAVRLAGALTKRDGYGINEAAGTPEDVNGVSRDVDGRDLWSARLSVGWEPIEQIRVNLMWERFEEDDNRVRTSKQLCKHDPGPAMIGDLDTSSFDEDNAILTFVLANMSQGCLPTSLYSDEAYGTPNGASLPYVSGLFWGVFYGKDNFTGNVELQGLGGNPYYDPPGAAEPFLTPRCVSESAWVTYFPINICTPDPYNNARQSRDLRTIYSLIEPKYQAKSDVFDFSMELDLTEGLTFTSQTVYARDEYYATQDYNRFSTIPIFNDSDLDCAPVSDKFGFPATPDCSPGAINTYADGWYDITPGGVFTDPQLGASRSLMGQDLSRSESEQFNQEFRLASNFDASWNFSLGANFTHFETLNDYYVFLNAATLLTSFYPFNTHLDALPYVNPCLGPAYNLPPASECLYVDPNPLESINGEGHNYFRSANPYQLTSSAIFGELYWQATDTLKFTLGGRMSWDRKVFTPIASQLLLMDYRLLADHPGYTLGEGAGPEECTSIVFCQLVGTGVYSPGEGSRGSPASPDIVQEWREPTGRLIVDWKPDLSFTDETMVYGSIAHGYKGGGANPPRISAPSGLIFDRAYGEAFVPKLFDPEFVNAFEIGTKNTLMDGALVLNGAAFYYDYDGYQVSKIVERTAANENFDATVWGVEVEWVYSPTRNLRFNGTFGHLDTQIADGEASLDLMDRAAGGNTPYGEYDSWMLLKPWLSSASNCIAPTELVEMVLTADNYGPGRLVDFCPTGQLTGLTYATQQLPDGSFYDAKTEAPNGGAGFSKELGGNELPNAPHWTASLGAQYRFALPAGWDGTVRGDFYWQSQSFHRVYNTQYDKLRAWTNTNVSLWFEQPDWGVTAEVYVKNVFDETPITDAFLNSDDSGLTTNVFTLDPRLVGVSVRKSF